MNLKKVLSCLALATLIIAGSCSEDELPVAPTLDAVSSEMMVFESEKEFRDLKANVSYETMKKWGESKGFKSFGVICDEFYQSIDFDKFSSHGELKSFVNQNSEYVQLVEDENGELELQTVLAGNSERYFINKDRMFQVGNTVFKVFNDGLASTGKENLDRLKTLDDQAFSSMESGGIFSLEKNAPDVTYVDHGREMDNTHYQCGTTRNATGTEGNERVKCSVESGAARIACSGSTCTKLVLYYTFELQPQKKTLGVWHNVTRTLFSWSDIAVHAQNPYFTTWFEFIDDVTFSNHSSNGLSYYRYQEVTTTTVWEPYPIPFHLGGFILNFGDQYVDLNDIPNDQRLCNVGIF